MASKRKQMRRWKGAKFTDPRRKVTGRKPEPGVPVVIEAPTAQASGRREDA